MDIRNKANWFNPDEKYYFQKERVNSSEWSAPASVALFFAHAPCIIIDESDLLQNGLSRCLFGWGGKKMS